MLCFACSRPLSFRWSQCQPVRLLGRACRSLWRFLPRSLCRGSLCVVFTADICSVPCPTCCAVPKRTSACSSEEDIVNILRRRLQARGANFAEPFDTETAPDSWHHLNLQLNQCDGFFVWELLPILSALCDMLKRRRSLCPLHVVCVMFRLFSASWAAALHLIILFRRAQVEECARVHVHVLYHWFWLACARGRCGLSTR